MKKRSIQRNVFLVVLLAMFFGLFGNSAYSENKANRIYGQDRIKTSIEISKNGWQEGSEYVVLAQSMDYPDALCAGPLAQKFNAPILLTNKDGLRDDTKQEIKRLGVKKVFIVGGPNVIKDNINSQLKGIGIKDIERLWGDTRYETALKVAEKLEKIDAVFIVSGEGYADSLSVASIASKKGYPILLTQKDAISPRVKQFIEKNNVSKVYAVGGDKVISNSALKGIANVERIYGKDRFETNKKVIERFKEDFDFSNVYFAIGYGPYGNEFADALSISPLAARMSAPVVLVYKTIDKGLEELISYEMPEDANLIAIGGEKVVPSSILQKINPDLEVVDITEDDGTSPDTPGDQDPKEGTFTIKVLNNNGNTVMVEKKLKAEENKNAMDYLKSVASVSETNGFITEINSISNKKIEDLSLEQRERGILGQDWFIYINGAMASKGAKAIYPVSGDVLSFEFNEWDWRILVDPGYTGNMPIKVEVPASIGLGESFKVKATCVYQPIYKAVVKVDGKEVGTTDLNGSLNISINISGEHKVSVSKDGGEDVKTVTVVKGGEDPGGDTGEVLKKVDGDISLIIKKAEGNKVKIQVISKDKMSSNTIAITLYNDKNVLGYIGQATLVDGKCEFDIVLDPGQYHGYYKENLGQRIEITNFTVK